MRLRKKEEVQDASQPSKEDNKRECEDTESIEARERRRKKDARKKESETEGTLVQ